MSNNTGKDGDKDRGYKRRTMARWVESITAVMNIY